MEKFFEFIESSLPNGSNDKFLYKFKKKTLDEMVERANQLSARGLKDQNVLNDLIISEYKDIVADYNVYAKEKAEKQWRRRFAIGNIIGSVIYILVLLIMFLGISFSTHSWSTTWVIMVDGILIWIAYLLTLGINRVIDMKRIFHFIARIMLGIEVMVLTVAAFLICMAVLHIPNSWVIVIVGIMCVFIADGLFASVTKQKLAIISWLCYIPAISAMLYIVLGALGVFAWSAGWVMIPLSLIIDLIIIAASIRANSKYDQEVVDSWKEN
ncbi:MAG: hypothetical protein ACLUFN_10410 [Eubacterium sp.]